MSARQTPLLSLHEAYCRLTQRTPIFAVWERAWHEFQKTGYTLDDLTTCLHFILRENRRHEWKYSLALGKLIEDVERFDDLLSEARARQRNRIRPAGAAEKVLADFRGHTEPKKETMCQSVKDVLKRMVE